MRQRDEQYELLTAYLDNEVTQSERADIEALLAADPNARRLLEELRLMRADLLSLDSSVAPIDLAARVVDELEKDALFIPRSAPKRAGPGGYLALAASLALAVGVGWWVWPILMPAINKAANSKPDYQPIATDTSHSYDSVGRIAHDLNTKKDAVGTSNSVGHWDADAEDPLDVITGLFPGDAVTMGLPVREGAADDNFGNRKNDAGWVDSQLAQGNISIERVAMASNDMFANQLVVDVRDPSDVWVIEDTIESCLTKQGVPNLRLQKSDTVISSARPFFIKRGAGGNMAASELADDTELNQEVMNFAVNLSRDEAAMLCKTVDQTADETGVAADYAFNGIALGQELSSATVLDNASIPTELDEGEDRIISSLSPLPKPKVNQNANENTVTSASKGHLPTSKPNNERDTNPDGSQDLTGNVTFCISIRAPQMTNARPPTASERRSTATTQPAAADDKPSSRASEPDDGT